VGEYIRVRFRLRRPWSLRLRSAPAQRQNCADLDAKTPENKCLIIALLMHSRRPPGDKATPNNADRPTDTDRQYRTVRELIIRDCERLRRNT